MKRISHERIHLPDTEKDQECYSACGNDDRLHIHGKDAVLLQASYFLVQGFHGVDNLAMTMLFIFAWKY